MTAVVTDYRKLTLWDQGRRQGQREKSRAHQGQGHGKGDESLRGNVKVKRKIEGTVKVKVRVKVSGLMKRRQETVDAEGAEREHAGELAALAEYVHHLAQRQHQIKSNQIYLWHKIIQFQ